MKSNPLIRSICGRVGWLVAGELQVLEMAVHPSARRRGLGAALLEGLLRDCG